MRRRLILGALALALQLLLAGCGGGGGGSTEAEPALVAGAADPAVYDGIVAALAKARIPVSTCPVSGGGAYEVIPPAPRNLSQGVSHLQYTDGRVYELGPCETPSEKRTLLRMYHFADQQARDAAVDSAGERGIRPTSSWTYQNEFTIELWQDDPTDTGNVGGFAAAAHLAIGGLPGARHVQVGNNR